MILNEIITNSYKHAFDEMNDGIISIKMKENAGRIYVEVQDNGKGVNKDILKNKNRMGVTIINMLIDQLGANMKVEKRVEVNFLSTSTSKN
jgi:two-component sensor histidine kinase